MKRLTSVARRSTFLGASVAMFAATLVPTAQVFAANALNPLTERSLLLTSSAPGYVDTDGSGNSFDGGGNSVGENYAPAGTGPNGKKSGQTFTFKHSSSATISGFSLQYCTTAAGNCQAPGNNEGDARPASGDRETNAQAHPNSRSDLDFVTGGGNTWTDSAIPTGALTPLGEVDGQFQVTVDGVRDSGWTLTTTNREDDGHSGALTGKNNYATLTKNGGVAIESGDVVEVRFRPSENVYITNPGANEFFVKINTYNSHETANVVPGSSAVVDGGVTVANVMTDSIHITTKVLETMAFSVGVENRDKLNLTAPATHGTCDAIQVINNNRLNLGNSDAEYSLETGRAHDVHSYWRLSSNSSGGATVYYSGDTLRNTVGDAITPVGNTAQLSNPGTEQFGVAFVNDSEMVSEVSSAFANLVTTDPNYQNPSISPLVKEGEYNGGSGAIWAGPDAENPVAIDAAFAFDTQSQTVPRMIAQNNDGVLSCATAKMRYVGNIAADTPAGVYTTKINYLAAPQY